MDLSEQHMYFYQNGEDIFESDIVSGDMRYSDRQTPAGIYTIYYKKSPDVLRGKQYLTQKYLLRSGKNTYAVQTDPLNISISYIIVTMCIGCHRINRLSGCLCP